jgi:hypothetical protein
LSFCRSKLHELAAHFGEDGHHLEMTLLAATSSGLLSNPDTPLRLSPLYVRTILAFITDCHSILDSLLIAGTETLRALPLLSGLRGPYAFKALAMLERRADDPKNKMSQIVDRETIRWLHYAKKVSRMFEEASANGLFVAPTMALRIRDRAVNQDRLRQEVYAAEPSHVEESKTHSSVAREDAFKVDSLVCEWPDFDLSPWVWDLFPLDGERFQLQI